MATRPTVYPEWALLDQVDPTSGQNNVVEPPAAWKNYGWDYQEKPPRNYDNWRGRTAYLWIKYLDETAMRSASKVVVASNAPGDAKGDYTCDGDNDQTEINTAITAVSAAGGGIVLLSEGSFVIEGTINLASNVALIGMGRTATVLGLPADIASSINMISCGSAINFMLGRFQLDGNRAYIGAYSHNGIFVTSGASDIRGVLFDLLVKSMKGTGTAGCGIVHEDDQDLRIEECVVTDCENYGIETRSGSSRLVAERCLVYANDDTGIRFRGDDSVASDCVVRANGLNVDIAGTANTLIASHALDSDTYHGVTVSGSYNAVQACTVKGNYGHGLYLSSATGAKVHDNLVSTNSQGADDTSDGINVTDSTDCSLQCNMVRHGGLTNQQKYGIHVAGTSSGIFVQNNDCRDASKDGGADDIYDEASGAVWSLMGLYVASSSGGSPTTEITIDKANLT